MKLENLKLEKITFEKAVTKKDENNEKTNSIKIKTWIIPSNIFWITRKRKLFLLPILFSEEHKTFINFFERFSFYLKNEVNIRKSFPKRVGGRHYHKFSPLKSKTDDTDEILFLKIGYNSKNEKVFTHFYDKFSRKICYNHLINKKLSCDICIKIESIFSNKNGETFLNCNLNEATIDCRNQEEKRRKLVSREEPIFDENYDNYCDNCYFFETKDEKETIDSDSDSDSE